MTAVRTAGPANWPDHRPIRVGVIGVGSMGRNHLRVYDTLKNVKLVGLYDPDIEAARTLARQYECTAFDSLDAAADALDAVSICSPSTLHCEIGARFLGAGIHCLIEKPLATTEEECRTLIHLARQSEVKLLVGHIERYNPAVRQLSLMLAARGQKIRAIDARRLSHVSKRINDIDVVADLMVHDLDIVMSLAGNDVSVHSAVGIGAADHVTALLDMGNDAMATLTASRITHNTVRQITVTTDAAVIEVDYMNQSVEIFWRDQVKRNDGPDNQFGDYTLDVALERVQVRRTEPLRLELAHFVDTIREDIDPLVPGEDGLAALRLVRQIGEHLARRKPEAAAAE